MERKKISNFTILIIALAISAVMIISKTVLIINEKHEERLLYSMHSQVEYYAKRCYLEEKCSGDTTLNTLYENNYIKSEVVNPITKEVLDKNLVIKYIDNEIVINW